MPTRTITRTQCRLKGCPRCGGDLMLDAEEGLVCLQCGRRAPDSMREQAAPNETQLNVDDEELSHMLRLLDPVWEDRKPRAPRRRSA